MLGTLLFLFPYLLFVTAQPALHTQIERTASLARGRVGVACSLPGKQLACDVNASAKLPMQSVYKLPIAIATLHAVEQGRFWLQQKVKFRPSDLISRGQHSPLRDQHPNGGVEVAINDLLRLAVCESDGVASDILLRTLGGPSSVDAYIKSLGIAGISIRDTEKTIGANVHAQYRNYAEPRANGSSAAIDCGSLPALARAHRSASQLDDCYAYWRTQAKKSTAAEYSGRSQNGNIWNKQWHHRGY